MLQYSIFICIPSDLVLLAQVRQQPNADLFLPNKILPGLLYNSSTYLNRPHGQIKHPLS